IDLRGRDCPTSILALFVCRRRTHLIYQAQHIGDVTLEHRRSISDVYECLLRVVVLVLVGQPKIGLLEKPLITRGDSGSFRTGAARGPFSRCPVDFLRIPGQRANSTPPETKLAALLRSTSNPSEEQGLERTGGEPAESCPEGSSHDVGVGLPP